VVVDNIGRLAEEPPHHAPQPSRRDASLAILF
jgi:hypothetical protein